MAELDSLLGKAKKGGDKNMEMGILGIISESRGAIHSREFAPFVERSPSPLFVNFGIELTVFFFYLQTISIF